MARYEPLCAVASRGRVLEAIRPRRFVRLIGGDAAISNTGRPAQSQTTASEQRAYPTFEATAITKGALRCIHSLLARAAFWASLLRSLGPADLYPSMRHNLL